MILADKIIKHRKMNNWSQEEFAEKMGVSRQAVSKWESAQTIPEISKILLMSEIFGVTVDYLLKDDIEDTEYSDENDSTAQKKITLNDAHKYINMRRKESVLIAIATFMCIISPILLIILAGMSEFSVMNITENLAAAIGITALLLIVGIAVGIYIYCSFKGEEYDFIGKEYCEKEYGVEGLAKQKAQEYRPRYILGNIVATIMCVLCALPLILAAFTGNELLTIYMVGVLLLIVAVAVYIFVLVGTRWECYQNLRKKINPKSSTKEKGKNDMRSLIHGLYWPIILCVYLLWSFIGNAWKISWIIWIIAGVFAPVFSKICGVEEDED